MPALPRLAAVAVAASIPLCAHAADASADPIVVTATGIATDPDRTGQTITVVTRDDLDRWGSVTVADAIARLPGIAVARTGGAGQPTAVRIRGAEDAHTLVLIDGVRVNDPSSPGGAFDFATLTTGTLSSVEVLSGPNAVIWGSSALGGVVNVATATQPALFAEYGMRDQWRVGGTAAVMTDSVEASASAAFTGDGAISAAALGTEGDPFEQASAQARLRVPLGASASVMAGGWFAASRVDYDGFAPPFFTLGDTPDFARTRQVTGYVRGDARTGAVAHRLGYERAETDRRAFDGLGSPPVANRGVTERFTYRADWTGPIRATAGAEHEASRIISDDGRRTTGIDSVYALLSGDPVAAVTLSAGARIDRHRAFGTHATLGANAVLRAGATTVRATLAQGFKAPTLFQLYSDFYGNAALRPETADSIDLGVAHTIGDATVRVTGFARVTRNQIGFFFGARPDRPFGYYENIDRTRAYGVEAALRVRPARGLTVDAAYGWLDAIDRTTRAPLLRRPRHSADLDWDWQAGRALIGGSVRARSASRDVDSLTFLPTDLPGYVLFGLRGSVDLGDRLTLHARADNLFDRRYTVVSGYGTEGLSVVAGVRARW